MFANYHTHTWRCKHADPNERTYIETAMAGGMKILGFSDHTPYPGVQSVQMHHRMNVEQASEYFNTIRSLREEYAGHIEIHAGVEAEYYPDQFPALLELLRENSCEYMILGQHFLAGEEERIYNFLPTEDDSRLIRYADEVVGGIETGFFTYVAHPDVLNYAGSNISLYRTQMRRICQAANRRHIPLEVNLMGICNGKHYPDCRFWEVAAEEGCRTVLGCDAHHPEYLNHPAGETAGYEFLAKWNITPEKEVPLVPIK